MFVLLVGQVVAVFSSSAVAQKIYWTETTSRLVRRSNIDGSEIETLIAGLNWPTGIVIDTSTETMYFASGDGIFRANLDGREMVRLVQQVGMPQGLAIDSQSGSIYWAEFQSSTPFSGILRANLDGTNVEGLIEIDSGSTGLAIDTMHGKMYWSISYGNIYRANLDGTDVEVIVDEIPASGITIDHRNEKIYWAWMDGGYIQRANLDGSNVEDVFHFHAPNVATWYLYDLAIDPVGEKLYWSGLDAIYRISLDGSDLEKIADGPPQSKGIALDLRQTHEAHLDIKPGSCPNVVNPTSRGVVSMALIGSDSFDIHEIDIDSIRLTRSDGLGNPITPHFRRSRIMASIEDVTTPLESEDCSCHQAEGDGVDDLVLKFSTIEMNDVFNLEEFSQGAEISLTLSGNLLDGTAFTTTDCIMIRGNRRQSINRHSIRR